MPLRIEIYLRKKIEQRKIIVALFLIWAQFFLIKARTIAPPIVLAREKISESMIEICKKHCYNLGALLLSSRFFRFQKYELDIV
jgi:hypothetical protein